MAKYTLGGREYRSKAAARSEFQRILHDTPLGRPIEGDDAELVGLLISEGRHPEAAEKIGPGVAGVVVRPASYGQRCFWLLRVDGTEVDFSYLTALNGPANVKTEVVWALREEIGAQIQAFRDETAPVSLCELCLQPADGVVHVDHAEPTFDQLATRFAEAAGGWDGISVECVGAYGRRLKDRGLAEVWRVYHLRDARLRVVHASCNLSRARGAL
jgi:hypothetical protein